MDGVRKRCKCARDVGVEREVVSVSGWCSCGGRRLLQAQALCGEEQRPLDGVGGDGLAGEQVMLAASGQAGWEREVASVWCSWGLVRPVQYPFEPELRVEAVCPAGQGELCALGVWCTAACCHHANAFMRASLGCCTVTP